MNYKQWELIIIIGVIFAGEALSTSLNKISKDNEEDYSNIIGDVNELRANARQTRYPCTCGDGLCSCCTGFLLAQLNQKGCVNITYVPDEFQFKLSLIYNNRVLYNTNVSGKNPPPTCVRIPRVRQVKFCARFSNLYFTGPNMHVCVDADVNWEDFQLFQMSFDCFRFGADGIAHLPPEVGGGVSNASDEDDDEEIEDYDDNA